MREGHKYSLLAIVSLIATLILHVLHWLLTPLLIGAAVDAAAAADHSHHHIAARNEQSPSLLKLVSFVLIALNAAAVYFAVRQLLLAWKERDRATRHTRLCSAASIAALGAALYTILTL